MTHAATNDDPDANDKEPLAGPQHTMTGFIQAMNALNPLNLFPKPTRPERSVSASTNETVGKDRRENANTDGVPSEITTDWPSEPAPARPLNNLAEGIYGFFSAPLFFSSTSDAAMEERELEHQRSFRPQVPRTMASESTRQQMKDNEQSQTSILQDATRDFIRLVRNVHLLMWIPILLLVPVPVSVMFFLISFALLLGIRFYERMKPNMEKVIIPDSTSVFGLFYFMYMEYRDEMIQDAQKQVKENVVSAPEKVFQKGAGMYIQCRKKPLSNIVNERMMMHVKYTMIGRQPIGDNFSARDSLRYFDQKLHHQYLFCLLTSILPVVNPICKYLMQLSQRSIH